MLQVKINALNEMKRIRNNTYSDKLSWVDEVIQNAQRAKATEVHITVDLDKFVIEDNGVGCSSPQVLFEKNISGWDSSINNEHPFGEGLFSVLSVANTAIIESIGFTALWDMGKMFEEGTLDCIDSNDSNRKSGFVLQLNDMLPGYLAFDVEKRAKEVAQYISGIQFYVNDEPVEYVGYKSDNSKFAINVEHDDYKGWIRPYNFIEDYGIKVNTDGITVFAHERKVRTIYFTGVVGVIENNNLNLRCPDRKDFMYDNDYYNFQDNLKKDIKGMLIQLLNTADDKAINKYSEVIDYYLRPEEYAKYMKILPFAQYEEAKKLSQRAKNEDQQIQDAPMLTQQLNIQECPEAIYSPIINNVSDSENKTRVGIEIDKIKNLTFYVDIQSVAEYDTLIETARRHQIPVVVIRNVLERKVVELFSNVFKPITELGKSCTLQGSLSNIGEITPSESRAMMLFRLISNIMKCDKNVFKIANVSCYKIASVDGATSDVKDECLPLYVKKGIIYVDRDSWDFSMLKDKDDLHLRRSDYVFLFRHMKLILNGLSQLVESGDVIQEEIYSTQLDIMDKILHNI